MRTPNLFQRNVFLGDSFFKIPCGFPGPRIQTSFRFGSDFDRNVPDEVTLVYSKISIY
ncbi:hypothetical protein LEP1GSC038_2648 [Leptospira weilii str. 2006001855]|uniref:Uncharacterized protein n=1 Tax=Leptospira weilii str. 2006001855 TaxID=996804 RepID=M6G3Y9_9LEPT|nr:hypothetical protein LEP1GSC038_2648 [Leptospira weilii str. 2006001855]